MSKVSKTDKAVDSNARLTRKERWALNSAIGVEDRSSPFSYCDETNNVMVFDGTDRYTVSVAAVRAFLVTVKEDANYRDFCDAVPVSRSSKAALAFEKKFDVEFSTDI